MVLTSLFCRVARLQRARKNTFAAMLSPAFGLLEWVNDWVNDWVNESVLSGAAPSARGEEHVCGNVVSGFCLLDGVNECVNDGVNDGVNESVLSGGAP